MKHITILFLFIISFSSFGQQMGSKDEKLLKNSINLNVGTLYIVYGVTLAANYERSFLVAENGIVLGTGLGIGAIFALDAFPLYGKLYALFGKKNNKFEIGFSAGTLLGNPDFTDFTISPLIAYRRYSLNRGSYFRTGIGFTEGVFIGLGFRF